MSFIMKKLKTDRGYIPLYEFNCVESTQRMAKVLYDRYKHDTYVVWAKEQLKGRGRRERVWHSPRGGLYFSLFYENLEVRFPQLASLASGLAMREALKEIADISCDLKWPNDILYRDKKLCGILSEAASCGTDVHRVIIGVGVNVNAEIPHELKDIAVCLKEIIGNEVDLEGLLSLSAERLLFRIAQLETKEGQEEILDSYKRHCTTLGSTVTIILDEGSITGQAIDITQEGALQVLASGTLHSIATGDVIHVRKRG
ncbi:MAG TPA: biotin--[acetyl-CoA-carboxylase] ligase [Acetomicrobium flavidum]|uniref:biotin--[biotin carboxyl-carrier protein] ligase n=2 Tax=Acetomicrobium flavidum TaxID=49896 RepID=A0ABY1JBL0_9BACT|nr:BirA family transcriptional regulator, biotin operon repressor / biotin-[acetyl-CoA-carboxylase] ligase [Acetomicrobium flavidum]HOJ81680.1 biotin--[acetyl-CoA-carboxylase] ligase [Acetomicrobium flavidum]